MNCHDTVDIRKVKKIKSKSISKFPRSLVAVMIVAKLAFLCHRVPHAAV